MNDIGVLCKLDLSCRTVVVIMLTPTVATRTGKGAWLALSRGQWWIFAVSINALFLMPIHSHARMMSLVP